MADQNPNPNPQPVPEPEPPSSTDFGHNARLARERWDEILELAGYQHTAAYQIDEAAAQRLGRALFDYMTAAVHDTNWEGYDVDDLVGIDNLLTDLRAFMSAEIG